ncbi:MAG: hypothetical protein PHR25_00650 [Clostridia bacterium]|nr:hypothetical protein [Clostridia bacterium]MDD4375277.1 hypothetical protein [Clostridia bacterium]
MLKIIKNKKLIYMILFATVIVLLFQFLISLEKNKVIQVNSMPITNKIIVLDAGHGLPDERSSRI